MSFASNGLDSDSNSDDDDDDDGRVSAFISMDTKPKERLGELLRKTEVLIARVQSTFSESVAAINGLNGRVDCNSILNRAVYSSMDITRNLRRIESIKSYHRFLERTKGDYTCAELARFKQYMLQHTWYSQNLTNGDEGVVINTLQFPGVTITAAVQKQCALMPHIEFQFASFMCKIGVPVDCWTDQTVPRSTVHYSVSPISPNDYLKLRAVSGIPVHVSHRLLLQTIVRCCASQDLHTESPVAALFYQNVADTIYGFVTKTGIVPDTTIYLCDKLLLELNIPPEIIELIFAHLQPTVVEQDI